MKTMKKLFSMAALALVGATFTGCSSDDDSIIDTTQQPEVIKSNVVTMTTTVGLDDGASTRALTSGGVKTFAAGDQIAVIYKNTSGETVTATSNALTDGDITNEDKNATFTVTLTDPKASEAVRYIYPAAMLAATVATNAAVNADANVKYDALATQDGTLTTLASTLDLAIFDGSLTSGAALPASASMTNQFAILAVTLKNADGSSEITSSITGLTLSDGTNTYNVNRSAVAGPIYVAIFPTADATITVTATSGTKNYTKTLTGKTYAKGNGYNVSWRMTESLAGKFSVSDSKQVYFSKGNLRYASDTWSFFDNQYDYYIDYSADAWDKFGWSTSATTYGMKTSNINTAYSGDFADWGNNSALQTALGTGWFTLSSAEWEYLFNTRTVNNGQGSGKSYTLGQSVNDVLGVVLYPDDYTGTTYTTGSEWSTFESAGCVFLPAAGYRSGSLMYDLGTNGYYWSATPNGTDKAYDVYFGSGFLNPAAPNGRYRGLSVRLVHQVE